MGEKMTGHALFDSFADTCDWDTLTSFQQGQWEKIADGIRSDMSTGQCNSTWRNWRCIQPTGHRESHMAVEYENGEPLYAHWPNADRSSERISRHLVECVADGIPVRNGRIQRHPYQRDPQSGSGNCVCARHDVHAIHQPPYPTAHCCCRPAIASEPQRGMT